MSLWKLSAMLWRSLWNYIFEIKIWQTLRDYQLLCRRISYYLSNLNRLILVFRWSHIFEFMCQISKLYTLSRTWAPLSNYHTRLEWWASWIVPIAIQRLIFNNSPDCLFRVNSCGYSCRCCWSLIDKIDFFVENFSFHSRWHL